MAKNEVGRSKSNIPSEGGQPAPGDSGPPRDGSVGLWRDKYGRQCIGNECFHAAIDVERTEVRVIIDRAGPCGGASQEDIRALTDSLKSVVGAGAGTVYETESRAST